MSTKINSPVDFLVRVYASDTCKRLNVPKFVERDAVKTAFEHIDNGASTAFALHQARNVIRAFLSLAGYNPKGVA